MFYRGDNLEELLKCKRCQERYMEPKIIDACSQTICSNCALELTQNEDEFLCFFCKIKHKIPEGGFKPDLSIEKFLKLQGAYVDQSSGVKELRKNLNELNLLNEKFENSKLNLEFELEEHCSSIKNKIDLICETRIEEINNMRITYLEYVDEYKESRIQNIDAQENIKEEKEEISCKIFIQEINDYLKNFEIDEEIVQKHDEQIVLKIKELQNLIEKLEVVKFNGKKLDFKENDGRISNLVLGYFDMINLEDPNGAHLEFDDDNDNYEDINDEEDQDQDEGGEDYDEEDQDQDERDEDYDQEDGNQDEEKKDHEENNMDNLMLKLNQLNFNQQQEQVGDKTGIPVNMQHSNLMFLKFEPQIEPVKTGHFYRHYNYPRQLKRMTNFQNPNKQNKEIPTSRQQSLSKYVRKWNNKNPIPHAAFQPKRPEQFSQTNHANSKPMSDIRKNYHYKVNDDSYLKRLQFKQSFSNNSNNTNNDNNKKNEQMAKFDITKILNNEPLVFQNPIYPTVKNGNYKPEKSNRKNYNNSNNFKSINKQNSNAANVKLNPRAMTDLKNQQNNGVNTITKKYNPSNSNPQQSNRATQQTSQQKNANHNQMHQKSSATSHNQNTGKEHAKNKKIEKTSGSKRKNH